MTALLFACLLSQNGPVTRDAFGVPKIQASSFEEAFVLFGKTVAEDRLWQMETSRHVAEGRMAEIAGQSAVASDRDTVKTGYTDSEYQAMYDALPERARTAYRSYAQGVNETIDARKASGTLPPEYAANGLSPEPWTVKDSMAIVVMLSRRFGTGGAGELRNLALYLYLKTQPCKDRVLDVLDDLAWQNDPASIPTVLPKDDPLAKTHPVFPSFNHKTTQTQLDAEPKVGLLELVPAIRVANGDESRLIAESVQAPFETGSYCMVVAPSRSATGNALLLTGPQMGMSVPSIIHEVAIVAPEIKVAGIDVPGIPAVVIGNTPFFAWGLTTGVADIADIVVAQVKDADNQVYGTGTRPIQRFKQTINVKGGQPVSVDVVRTQDGPVILESKGTKSLFSQRMSYWMREVDSWATLYDLYGATSADEIDTGVSRIAMNMNFFFATVKGDTGWRYIGHFPVRPSGYDPRFPMPSAPETEWKGVLDPSKMPHVRDPKSGLIANWNNKPASWWPNMDSPVWGAVFRNEVLLKSLTKPKLATWDLEKAAWDIARQDTDTNACLLPLLLDSADHAEAKRMLGSFDGWILGPAYMLYDQAFDAFRKDLFQRHTGNFTNDAFFDRIVQPSVVLKAAQGKTSFDFLAGRKASALASSAVRTTWEKLQAAFPTDPAAWPVQLPLFRAPDKSAVFFSNRGTYLQVTELASRPVGRSMAPPGVTESGEFSDSQVNLAKQWVFKPMWSLGG